MDNVVLNVLDKIKVGAICLGIGILLGAAGVLIIAKGNSDQQFDRLSNTIDDGAETNRRLQGYYQQLKQTNSDVAGLVDGLREQIRSDHIRHREQIESILVSLGYIGEGIDEADEIIQRVIETIRSVTLYLQSGRDSP